MGIKDFLRQTNIGTHRNISYFKNKRVAIDAYSWIHKGIYTSAEAVFLSNDITGIYRFFYSKVIELLRHNITITFVFDGDNLLLKKSTEKQREVKRKLAAERLREPANTRDPAALNRLYCQSIDVTPEMAYAIKQRLEIEFPGKLHFLVAPYEADSQMAYLSRNNLVDFIISEDSDLLIFGAKCVFYKMDKDFNGDEVCLADLRKCENFDFKDWSHDQIIQFAICCGCDYLDSLKGIAFSKAYKHFAKTKTIEGFVKEMFDRLIENYYEKFICAYLSFKYQNVWCPVQNRMVLLQMPENHDEEYRKKALEYFKSFKFLGGYMEPTEVERLVKFQIDPITKIPFPVTSKYKIGLGQKNGNSGFGSKSTAVIVHKRIVRKEESGSKKVIVLCSPKRLSTEFQQSRTVFRSGTGKKGDHRLETDKRKMPVPLSNLVMEIKSKSKEVLRAVERRESVVSAQAQSFSSKPGLVTNNDPKAVMRSDFMAKHYQPVQLMHFKEARALMESTRQIFTRENLGELGKDTVHCFKKRIFVKGQDLLS